MLAFLSISCEYVIRDPFLYKTTNNDNTYIIIALCIVALHAAKYWQVTEGPTATPITNVKNYKDNEGPSLLLLT